MELGDPPAAEREQRSVLDVALDAFETALTDVIEKIESGGLDQLTLRSRRSAGGDGSKPSGTGSP